MDFGGNQIECPWGHDICLEWKREGGLRRCRNILTLSCQTGLDVTPAHWERALSFIFWKMHFKFYGRCLECVDASKAQRGSEFSWFFVVQFENSERLSIAECALRSTIENCLARSTTEDSGSTEDFVISGLELEFYRKLGFISYDFGTCLFIVVEAAYFDTVVYQRKYSFGRERKEVIRLINQEVRWYSRLRGRLLTSSLFGRRTS